MTDTSQETSFGHYRLADLLGRGGMGEVWRAHDTVTDRIVAIKVLPKQFADDDSFKQRFRREAHAAAQLNEPHVVPIHSYGEHDGQLYVDMRLIDGRDLSDMLSDGPLDPARAVMIVEQVAKALHAAHDVGLVHRDVKPSNVLIAEYDFAYLIDFGIARGVDQTKLTTTGSMIGTFGYMAPERYRDEESGVLADVYALACVLHECLTGSRPFPGASLESQMLAHLKEPPPKPSAAQPGVPTAFDAVIAKGMAKDPDERYQTTLELADAARAAVTTPIAMPPPPLFDEPTITATASFPDDEESQTTPSQPRIAPDEPAQPRPPWYRRRLIVILAAQAVAILAVIAVVSLWAQSGTEIFLEPATAAGPDPFTLSAAIPQPPATHPGTDPAGAPVSGDEVRTVRGDLPNLYGGTRNMAACDTEQMISYLGQNPGRGQAWASTFSITSAQIPAFIGELTPVLLRTDTRVTNHRYQNGQAAPVQSVLEAGTAVLVNRFGVPVVRCAGGNPLLEPRAVTSPRFSEQRWSKFSPQSVTGIRPGAAPVDAFILHDASTGSSFGRPYGGNGTNDIDDPRGTPMSGSLPPVAEPPVAEVPPAPPPDTEPVYTPYTPPPTIDTAPTTIEATPTTTRPPRATTTTKPKTSSYKPPTPNRPSNGGSQPGQSGPNSPGPQPTPPPQDPPNGGGGGDDGQGGFL